MDEWTKDGGGDITLCPLTGYEVKSIAQIACGLRLSYLPESQQTVRTLQLAMTPSQARELGQTLLRAAQHIEAQDLGTRQ